MELKQVVGGVIEPECEGCERIVDYKGTMANRCSVYLKPSIYWRRKYTGGVPKVGTRCPMATHLEDVSTSPKKKVRVGQQKQKKR